MNKRRAIFWIVITLIYTIGTFYLSSISRLPRVMVRVYHVDWILHAIEYGILGVLVMLTFNSLGMNSRGQMIWITLVFCGIVGGLNEIYQKFIPNRSPSFGDEIANLVGVAFFLGGYFLIRRSHRPTPESRILQ